MKKIKVNFRVQDPCRDKELLSNKRCNPVNFGFNDGSEGFKNASKAQEKRRKETCLETVRQTVSVGHSLEENTRVTAKTGKSL